MPKIMIKVKIVTQFFKFQGLWLVSYWVCFEWLQIKQAHILSAFMLTDIKILFSIHVYLFSYMVYRTLIPVFLKFGKQNSKFKITVNLI